MGLAQDNRTSASSRGHALKDNGAHANMERAEDYKESRARANMERVEKIIWRPEVGELGSGCSEGTEDRGENGCL